MMSSKYIKASVKALTIENILYIINNIDDFKYKWHKNQVLDLL